MPVPRPDIVRILLPLLIRMCPELKEAQVTRGLIVPIQKINPLNEEQEARNLSRKFKRKERTDSTKDSSQVINLDRAIKCVEESASKGGLVAKMVRRCVIALIQGGTGETNVTEDLLNPVVQCLRENALRQNTPRVKRKVSVYHRPSKGHGHGRHKIA